MFLCSLVELCVSSMILFRVSLYLLDMDFEMSNSLNLCSQCIDKPMEHDPDFTHSVNHTLIKTLQYIHKCLFPWLVNEARAVTTHLKINIYGIIVAVREHAIWMGRKSELLCGCCAKPKVAVTYWAITCGEQHFLMSLQND